jgi:hypothetical protein
VGQYIPRVIRQRQPAFHGIRVYEPYHVRCGGLVFILMVFYKKAAGYGRRDYEQDDAYV